MKTYITAIGLALVLDIMNYYSHKAKDPKAKFEFLQTMRVVAIATALSLGVNSI